MEAGLIGLFLFLPNLFVSFFWATKLKALRKVGGFFLLTHVFYFLCILPLAFSSIDNIYLWYLTAAAISVTRAFRTPVHYSLLKVIYAQNSSAKIPILNNLSWQIPLIVAPLLMTLLEKLFSPSSTIIAILAILVGGTLLSWPLRHITQESSDKQEVNVPLLKTLAQHRRVWIPALFDAIIMSFVSLPIILTLSLQRHSLPLENYGLFISLLLVITVLSCIVLAPKLLRWQPEKALALAFLGLAGGFTLLAYSKDPSTLVFSLIVLGIFDGISIVVRDNLLIQNSPTTLIGLFSSINGVFLAASDEFGQLVSGFFAQFFGLQTCLLLSTACAFIFGLFQLFDYSFIRESEPSIETTP